MSSKNHTTINKKSSPSPSSPSRVAVELSAGARIARTYELLRPIFFNLPYQDLVNCSLVSPGWKANIGTNDELQRRLYRIPTPIPENEDPHFEDASPASANIVIPMTAERVEFRGQPLLETTRGVIKDFIEKVSTNNFGNKTAQQAYEDFKDALYATRLEFRGIRSSAGWPFEYREIHCELCETFHTKLKHDHLHPILRFLEDVDICFKGHGTNVHADFSVLPEAEVPQSCWNDSMSMCLLLARNLKSAWEKMHRYGLQNDQVAKPLITGLVFDAFRTGHLKTDFISVTAPGGVRLREFINTLACTLHLEMRFCNYWTGHLRSEPGTWQGNLSGGVALSARIAFKTLEEYKAHFKSVPDIKRRLAEVYEEVNTLMQDIPGWNLASH